MSERYPPGTEGRFNYIGHGGVETFLVVESDEIDEEIFLEYLDGEIEAMEIDEFYALIEEGLITILRFPE